MKRCKAHRAWGIKHRDEARKAREGSAVRGLRTENGFTEISRKGSRGGRPCDYAFLIRLSCRIGGGGRKSEKGIRGQPFDKLRAGRFY